MYEELVRRLRNCATQPAPCNTCDLAEDGSCSDTQMKQAADAIEELERENRRLAVFVDNISKLPDCNTCMKKPNCEFMPKYGEYCRINCPAWLGESEPPKEET